MSLQITDPWIKHAVLSMLVERIDAGGIDELLQAGFTGTFLDAVRHRPARDLIKIAEVPQLDIRVRFDEQSVLNQLTRLDMMRRDAALREYFVINGAPRRLMCDLFRMSSEEVRQLREQLLPPDRQSGRAKLPPVEVRDEIHQRWQEIGREYANHSLREQFYRLHQGFAHLRIDAICLTLGEFDTQPRWQVTGLGALE